MMEDMDIKEPIEFQHNRITINALFSILETDFFGRYNYQEMQKYINLILNIPLSVILEDRRIRLNAWAAKILQIPVQKIKRNKFVNPKLSKKVLKDPKNLNFTIERIFPLTSLKKKEDITNVI